jgi:hypothetical protein
MANSNTRKILALRNENVPSVESSEIKPKEVIDEAKLKELKEIGKKASNFDEDLLTFNSVKASGETGLGVDWVLKHNDADLKKNRTTIAVTQTTIATLKRISAISDKVPAIMILDNILRDWVKVNSSVLKKIESKKEKKAYE